MSKNDNTIYVFVKGNKGKGAYEITDTNGEVLHQDTLYDIVDEKGNKLIPFLTDRKIIIKSLEHVRDNRGGNRIPSEPMIFIFTTFENNYDLAIGIKKPASEDSKTFLEKISSLKLELARNFKKGNNDDNVKLHFIPDDFENKMDHVNELLGKGNKKNRHR